jgi:hypothetical protein
MDDLGVADTNQQQVDSRANLVFFLRTLARQGQARAETLKSCSESSVTDEQIKRYVRQNGLL